MTRAIHQFMPVILVLSDIFFSFKQRMVDKLRRVMNVPNVRGKKKKEKKKESNALCLVIRKREDKVGECMRYIVMKLT